MKSDLTFEALCKHVGASPKTVRRLVKSLGLEPYRVATATFYTRAQAQRAKAEYEQHGGRWPRSRVKHA